MKLRLSMGFALILAACSPEPRVTGPQAFEALELDRMGAVECVLRDANGDVVLVTLADAPAGRARARFGGELLMLGTAAAPDLRAGGTARYQIQEYPSYVVDLELSPAGQGLVGTVSMVGATELARSELTGECKRETIDG